MRVRAFVWAITAGALANLAIAPSHAEQAAQAGATTQPDILWIITDDQRPDSVRAFNRAEYGHEMSPLGYVESPNIDRLAAEGVLFTHAYNQSPTCGPSRTSMHTGRYPFRNGKYGWESTHQTADFVRPAFTQLMADAGYSTALMGKSHYGIRPNKTSDGSWLGDVMTRPIYEVETEFGRDLERRGFGDFNQQGGVSLFDSILLDTDSDITITYPDGTQDEYIYDRVDRELTAEEKAKVARMDEKFDILRTPHMINTRLILGGENPQPAGKTVDANIVRAYREYLGNEGRDYKAFYGLDRSGPAAEKPIFVNLGFHLPHTPVLPPKEYRDRFKNKKYAIPEMTVDEMLSLPDNLRQVVNEAYTDAYTDEQKLQAIRDYYAFMAYGDALIGEAVSAFKANAERRGREWLIVYTVGDHGWHLNEHGTMGKFGPWEESLRGAVIVVSSDKQAYPAGTVNDELVEYVDFAATFLAAAGLDLDRPELDFLDGIDLARTLHEPGTQRDYIIGEQNLVNGHMAYMRTKDFAFSMRSRDNRRVGVAPKLNTDVTWALDVEPKKADLALWDLRIDPNERHNLATTLVYDDLAEWFRQKLGTIVLGDGRVEADWELPNSYVKSNFAGGADDKKADIPADIIPTPQILRPGPNR